VYHRKKGSGKKRRHKENLKSGREREGKKAKERQKQRRIRMSCRKESKPKQKKVIHKKVQGKYI
jgi:hypothetical protein